MVTEERFDRQEEDKRLVPAASQGIASAGENITKLGVMSADIQQRSTGLREQGDAEPRSIEAWTWRPGINPATRRLQRTMGALVFAGEGPVPRSPGDL